MLIASMLLLLAIESIVDAPVIKTVVLTNIARNGKPSGQITNTRQDVYIASTVLILTTSTKNRGTTNRAQQSVHVRDTKNVAPKHFVVVMKTDSPSKRSFKSARSAVVVTTKQRLMDHNVTNCVIAKRHRTVRRDSFVPDFIMMLQIKWYSFVGVVPTWSVPEVCWQTCSTKLVWTCAQINMCNAILTKTAPVTRTENGVLPITNVGPVVNKKVPPIAGHPCETSTSKPKETTMSWAFCATTATNIVRLISSAPHFVATGNHATRSRVSSTSEAHCRLLGVFRHRRDTILWLFS